MKMIITDFKNEHCCRGGDNSSIENIGLLETSDCKWGVDAK